ncbi:hypothetical protein B0H66DRAFT_589376 [Apodospora peruviana]|uniref:Rhodopsin domain-containing protein n=1 Tax=Apodospora peruviana TaxID=516989 RepID=A0AAE0IM31_9PEZI|nr:hypothetical protein B0H66DRAFT_589376 [Apodospora peruviana]
MAGGNETTTPGRVDPARAAESNTAMILTVMTVFHALALIFVSLRLYARLVLVKAPGRDDIAMALCGGIANWLLAKKICATGGWIVFVIQSKYGLGKHTDTIPKEDMIVFQHAGFWQSIVSTTCSLGLLKISIAFSLLRLSTHKWYNWALWATIGFVCCYSFMGAMTFFLHCSPMEAHWKTAIPGATCYSISLFVTFALINTSFNIFTDVLFAVFPIPIIWTLQMKRKLRLYLIGILSLGYFAVAMGIVKAVYQIAFSKEKDKTFYQSVQFWGFLQLNVGIIAACAPTLKPLFTRILGLSTTNYPYNVSGSQYHNGSRGGTRRTSRLREDTNSHRLVKLSSTVDEFDLEDAGGRRQGNLSNVRGGTNTGGTGMPGSFYTSSSGSEEMILGSAATTPPPLPRTVSRSGGRILKTTEVQVTVR